ncbi:MAG: GldG family protein [Spirochaetaceae bacterium]|jgi:ABC-type uncharacterized transport system involved in gliding motility auxiliary subunit|nr:GldG family protein [Spirochaetaceae bacterium]
MTKKQFVLITGLTIAALVLGLLISRRVWFRFDLTKNRAYTMAPASRAIRSEIPDQVRITYYLSDKLSAMYPQPAEITDVLREYAAYSRGKIRLSVRDPVKAGLTSAVQQLGIRPTQLEITEEAEATSALVYTGIAIEYLDKVEVLPLVFSLETLEYDITSRIRALVRDAKREVGVIVGDAVKQWAADYEYLNLMLTQGGFSVRVIPAGDEIPDSLPALFVLGGAEDLDPWALYRIDRYIQCGGNVLFAVTSVSVNVQTNEGRAVTDRGLLAMISRYGAEVKQALALDKAALLLTYQTPTPFGIALQQQIRYPHWIAAQHGSKDNPLTANFSGLDLFWPNPLELNPPQGVDAQALFTTTGEAWLMTKDFAIAPQSAAYLFEGEAPDTKGVKTLGAVLTGAFPSYFAGQAKPAREGAGEELPAMPAEPKEARIIVIGNTEIAANTSYAYTSRLTDLNFLVTAAAWLGDDDDIIAIRTRQGQGQLNKIVDPEKRARAEAAAQVINLALAPLALVIAGLLAAWRRRRRSSAG